MLDNIFIKTIIADFLIIMVFMFVFMTAVLWGLGLRYTMPLPTPFFYCLLATGHMIGFLWAYGRNRMNPSGHLIVLGVLFCCPALIYNLMVVFDLYTAFYAFLSVFCPLIFAYFIRRYMA